MYCAAILEWGSTRVTAPGGAQRTFTHVDGRLCTQIEDPAGNVTAFNTVWTYDIYQGYLRPGQSDRHYLRMGHGATVGGILLSVAAAYVAGAFNNIMEFPRTYPAARTFYLDVNYRSTPQILEFANKNISHNRVRFPKNLKSARRSGIKPVLVKCYSPRDEAAFVSQRVAQMLAVRYWRRSPGVMR